MNKDNFKPHMMYDKKTGKAVKAPTMAKHLALKKKGEPRHTSCYRVCTHTRR